MRKRTNTVYTTTRREAVGYKHELPPPLLLLLTPTPPLPPLANATVYSDRAIAIVVEVNTVQKLFVICSGSSEFSWEANSVMKLLYVTFFHVCSFLWLVEIAVEDGGQTMDGYCVPRSLSPPPPYHVLTSFFHSPYVSQLSTTLTTRSAMPLKS